MTLRWLLLSKVRLICKRTTCERLICSLLSIIIFSWLCARHWLRETIVDNRIWLVNETRSLGLFTIIRIENLWLILLLVFTPIVSSSTKDLLQSLIRDDTLLFRYLWTSSKRLWTSCRSTRFDWICQIVIDSATLACYCTISFLFLIWSNLMLFLVNMLSNFNFATLFLIFSSSSTSCLFWRILLIWFRIFLWI
jgi:hypothetical protein